MRSFSLLIIRAELVPVGDDGLNVIKRRHCDSLVMLFPGCTVHAGFESNVPLRSFFQASDMLEPVASAGISRRVREILSWNQQTALRFLGDQFRFCFGV